MVRIRTSRLTRCTTKLALRRPIFLNFPLSVLLQTSHTPLLLIRIKFRGYKNVLRRLLTLFWINTDLCLLRVVVGRTVCTWRHHCLYELRSNLQIQQFSNDMQNSVCVNVIIIRIQANLNNATTKQNTIKMYGRMDIKRHSLLSPLSVT